MATRSPVYDGNSSLMPNGSNSGGASTSAKNAKEKAPRYRTFRCPVCHTDFAVTKEDVGKTLICPDCETKVVVPADLNFDVETDYERQYFNPEKQKRDELYSPIRNPNRDGIDLKGAGVYDVKQGVVSGATPKKPKKSSSNKSVKRASFPCPLCRTIFSVAQEDVGKTLVCPDCETKVVVPAELNFDDQTDYERQYADKNQRDKLFSPLRNPNREGINVAGSDVYGVAQAGNKAAKSKKTKNVEASTAFNYRTFSCPLCQTKFSVTKEDVGKTLVCPDCETKVVVPADLNFDDATDYERQYFNADKQRRDALFSPLRNPNRDGIDVSGSGVYGLKEAGSKTAPSKKTKKGSEPQEPVYATFPCPLCRTLFSVTREDVGKTLVCPDCETKVVVPADLNFGGKFEQKRRDVEFSFSDDSDAPSATSNDKEEYYPVRCIVCETMLQVPREMLGKVVKCPDCGSETLVTDALKNQLDAINCRFAPQDRGVYDLGEIPEEPPLVVQGSDGRHIFVDKNTKTLAPDHILREVFAEKLAQNKGKKKKNARNSGAVAASLAPNEKNILTAWIAWREKRREKRRQKLESIDAEDLKRFLPPLVLRPRDGELVWTLASPPKTAPLFNKTFRAIWSEEIWTRGALIAIAFVALVFLMCDWLIPAAGTIAANKIGGASRMIAEGEMAVGISAATPLVLVASSLIGLFFWSVFGAGNSGASRVVEWRSEDILGFLGYGVWFATLVAVAFLPGLLTVSCLDLSLKGSLFATWNGTETTSLTDVLRSSVICWGSFWLFFPIFWLSTTQTDWPFCPINGRVFTSFFSQFLVWQQFYAVVTLCFYVPSVLWSLLVVKGLWFWYLAPVWTLLVPMTFGLLLGRLSWILDDEVRSMDFDD